MYTVDTFVVTRLQAADTVFRWSTLREVDTVLVRDGAALLRLIRTRDTLRLTGTCLPDTVRINTRVAVLGKVPKAGIDWNKWLLLTSMGVIVFLCLVYVAQLMGKIISNANPVGFIRYLLTRLFRR